MALTDLSFWQNSAQNCSKYTFLENLRTITQEESMEARQMTPFFHLLLLLYYFKINPPFSVVLSFMKLISILRPGLTKCKYTVDYHPNPSQLISRIHTRIFLGTRKRFISPESFLYIFLNLYIPP